MSPCTYKINKRLTQRSSNRQQLQWLTAMFVGFCVLIAQQNAEHLFREDRWQHFMVSFTVCVSIGCLSDSKNGILLFAVISILGFGKEGIDHDWETWDLVANYIGWAMALLLMVALHSLASLKSSPLFHNKTTFSRR